MSPEGEAILVFETMDIEDDGLTGILTTYDRLSKPLKWEWDDPKSDDYQAESGGLFYLQKTVEVSTSNTVGRFDRIGVDRPRYQFTAGKLVPGCLPIALIVILPCGWTLAKPPPNPKLTRAKAFRGRLACFWRLEGEEFRSESVEFSIEEGRPNVPLVNQRFRQVRTIEGPFAFLRAQRFWVAVGAIAALLSALVGFLTWLTQGSN